MGKLFGTDGIRGTFGEWPMQAGFFLDLGKALGTVLAAENQHPLVILGRDTRQSGLVLNQALCNGLLMKGIDVVDVGILPTAGIAFLTKKLGADAGGVVSASHNPVEQNGIKFFDRRAMKMPAEQEAEIEDLLLNTRAGSGDGAARRHGRLQDGQAHHETYMAGLIEEHPAGSLKGLRIVADCSNGAASQVAPVVFSRLGADTIPVCNTPDGMNINYQCGSEYARREPERIGGLVHQHGANLLLAFDGDADRVVFIDETGSLVDGDHILGFLAKYLKGKGMLLADTVVSSQMRNTGLKKYLEAAGLTLVETPVGDKYIVEKLFELRQQSPNSSAIALGGEQAGHIDLIDHENTTGDGIRTAIFVLRAFLESGLDNMSAFAAGVGKTPQIIASAFVGQGERFSRQELADLEQATLRRFDGLLRINLRYSGTEPLLRAMLESDGGLNEIDLARIAWGLCQQAQQLAGAENGEIDLLNCTHGGIIKV